MAAGKRVDDKGRKLPDGFSQRPDGRYMARFTHNGQRHTLYDVNLNKLKEKVNAKRYELENRTYTKKTRLTVNQWFDIWSETYYKSSVKPSTFTTLTCAYNNHVRNSELGKMKLTDLRNAYIAEYYMKMNETYKKPIIKTVHTSLKLMCECAIRNEMLDKNPTDGALSVLREEPKEERRVFTNEEKQKFFDYLKNDLTYNIYLPFYVIGFGTGMRIGELAGLTWKDIDYENNLIHVERTLYFQKNVGDNKACFHISTPKTINSRRNIPILPEVKQALERQKEIQKMFSFHEGYKKVSVDGVSGFIFTTKTGTPKKESEAWKVGKRIVKKMNEEEGREQREKNESRKFFKIFTPIQCGTHLQQTVLKPECPRQHWRRF